MPREQRLEELAASFKSEMQQYIDEGFCASDCFPFVFQNLIETTGMGAADRAELRQELIEWTKKVL